MHFQMFESGRGVVPPVQIPQSGKLILQAHWRAELASVTPGYADGLPRGLEEVFGLPDLYGKSSSIKSCEKKPDVKT